MVERHDYRYPFRIGPSGQGAQSGYADHVEQMIRQVLLTSPGERVDLPDFGCGLRKLIFAPHDRNLDSSTQMVVTRALGKWLAREIEVKAVKVLSPEESGDEAQLVVSVDYVLRETLTQSRTQVRIV